MKFKKKYFVLVIIIISIFLEGRFWIPHRSTTNEAVTAYLNWETSKYEIESMYGDMVDGETARYVVTSTDKYNYIGSINKGRTDGVNIHFLKLKHSFYGWYVAEDNSGP